MIFSFFRNQSRNENLSLLVDIGSASVGASLVKFEKGKPPHILTYVREDITFQEILSSNRFLAAMNHALDRALKSIYQNTKVQGAPKHIFCTLSSPWFILKSRRLSIRKDTSFRVTESAIDEFIKEDTARLKEELKETLPLNDVRIIEKKIVQLKLNGYDIKNPYGQSTSQMDIFLNIGVSSSKVIESIERKFSHFFHTKSVHLGVFTMAAFSIIRDMFPLEKDFLFLDVTGEATDVSLIKNDLILATVSFPRGENFFVREISTGLRTVHEEARTLFSMFLRDELEATKRARVANIVEQSEYEWSERFEKAINTLSEKGTLPRKVFFTTDSDIAPLFSRLIGTARSRLFTGAPFGIQYLDQLIVEKFISSEKGISRDPFIAVESLLAEKILMQHAK